MSTYELNFPIQAADPAPIQKIAQAVREVGESTKAINPAMGDLDAKIMKLVSSGLTLKDALAKIAAESGPAAVGLGNVAKASVAATATVSTLGNTLNTNTVPGVLAASAALRTLEGNMSIRAAERFITTFRGMGPLLQAAFPVFGAIAFGEVLGQMVSKVGDLYNAWNPVVKAEEQSLSLLKEYGAQTEKILHNTQRLREQVLATRFGQSALLKYQAETAEREATPNAQYIANVRAEIAAQEAKVKAGTFGPTASKMEWNPLIGDAEIVPARPGGMTGEAEAAREKLVGLNEKLAAAIAQQDESIWQAKAARASLEKEALDKATAREKKLEAFENQFYEKALDPISRIFTQRDVLVGELGPSSKPRASAAALVAASAELAKMGQEGDTRDFRMIVSGMKRESGVFGPEIKELDRYAADVSRSFLSSSSEVAALQAASIRQGVMRQSGRTVQLAELNADSGPTGRVGAIETGYQERLRMAKDLYDFELNQIPAIASKGKTEYDRLNITRVENAKAYWKLENENLDAADDRALKLAQVRHALLLGDKAAAGDVFDALMGGGAGVRGLAKSFATSQGRTIFQNATTGLFTQARQALGGMFGGDGPGGLLKGTVFGANPLDAAGVKLNTAGDNLNRAAVALMTASGVPAGTAVAAGVGGGLIPGGIVGGGATGPWGMIFSALGLGKKGTVGDIPGGVNAGLPGGALATLDSTNSYNTGPFTTAGGRSSIAGALFDPSASTANRVGSGVATAGALFAGYEGVSGGIRQGGARGTIGAVGSAAATAAVLDPEPISKAVLAMVATTAAIVTSVMGDPRQGRSQDIARRLKFSQFVDPVSINASLSSGSGYSDHDRFGNVRTSGLSPYGSQDQPYFDYRNNTTVPGRTTSPFGPGPAPQITVNVQTMDSKSFLENSDKIAAAVALDFYTQGTVRNAMQRTGP